MARTVFIQEPVVRISIMQGDVHRGEDQNTGDNQTDETVLTDTSLAGFTHHIAISQTILQLGMLREVPTFVD